VDKSFYQGLRSLKDRDFEHFVDKKYGIFRNLPTVSVDN
jgi:hypothetical protein